MSKLLSEFPYSLHEDNILIGIISKSPSIYNQTHEDYRNNVLKNEAWKNISIKVGRPTKSCKKRWRTIRDNYLKHIKTQRKNTSIVKRHCGRKYPLISKLAFLNYRQTLNVSEDEETNDTNEGSDNLEDVDMESSHLLEIIKEEDSNDDEIQIAGDSNGLPSISMLESDTADTFNASTFVDRDKTNFLCQVVRLIEKRNNEIEMLLKHVIELTKTKKQDDVDLFFKSMAITTKKLTPENIAKVKLKICQIFAEIEMQEK